MNYKVSFTKDVTTGMWVMKISIRGRHDEYYNMNTYSIINAMDYGQRVIEQWIKEGLLK